MAITRFPYPKWGTVEAIPCVVVAEDEKDALAKLRKRLSEELSLILCMQYHKHEENCIKPQIGQLGYVVGIHEEKTGVTLIGTVSRGKL